MSESMNPYQAPEADLVRAEEGVLPISLVSGGRRFLHYLLDVVVLQVIKLLIAIALVTILGARNSLLTNPLIGLLYGISLWMAYYIVMESRFQRTIGKWATGTMVVNEQGGRPSVGQIVKRTFCRFVPFEFLSCFGNESRGWHDEWSGTYVVRAQKLL